MAQENNHIEMLERAFPHTSGSAFASARAQVLASGQSLLQSEDGTIYEIFPMGAGKSSSRLNDR